MKVDVFKGSQDWAHFVGVLQDPALPTLPSAVASLRKASWETSLFTRADGYCALVVTGKRKRSAIRSPLTPTPSESATAEERA